MKGFRIVKGRTERQREAASAYQADSVVSIPPRDAGLPASSWWTEPCSRDEFDQRQAREQQRIITSKFGRQRVVVD